MEFLYTFQIILFNSESCSLPSENELDYDFRVLRVVLLADPEVFTLYYILVSRYCSSSMGVLNSFYSPQAKILRKVIAHNIFFLPFY